MQVDATVRLTKADGVDSSCSLSVVRVFDPDEGPQPNIDATLEDRLIGGLGLLLVREVSDAFRYVRDGEHNIYRILLCDPNPPFEVIQSAKAS